MKKDPSPPGALGEQAAEEDGRTAAATPLIAPQAPSAVLRSLPSRKVVVELGKGRGGCHERGADALDEPGGDQHARGALPVRRSATPRRTR